MTIILEPYHLFMIFVALITAFFALFKILANQILKNIDDKFLIIKGVEESLANTIEHANRLERDFLRMKADLPLHYTRREDYTKHDVQIEALSTKITQVSEAFSARVDKLGENLGAKIDKLRDELRNRD